MLNKAINLLLILIVSTSVTNAQKYDNIWLLGYDAPIVPNDSFCISVLDFSSGSLQVNSNETASAFFQETDASLCDAEGNLLVYSNGVHIFNRLHQIMENGDWLVPGNDVPSESYHIPQGVLFLYQPENNNRIILIHIKYGYIEEPLWDATVVRLNYSVIDISANNGNGKVIQKNIPILLDTLDYGKITAVRHGNGRDWWIIVNEVNSNRFYKLLLEPGGLHTHDNQAIGSDIPLSLGQAVFSPNGKIYATVGGVDDVQGNFLNVYDFDRCTGVLSNPRSYNWHSEGDAVGMAISPNSRYLYVPTSKVINQFDLTAPNLAASRKTVATYDGYQSPFGSKFYLAQLGPDHKIYINCSNGETVMHVIEAPDKPGVQCNVRQHAIQLPCYNAQSMPNFPNYHLYDLPGSPCDTLGISVATSAPEKEPVLQLLPNPATEEVRIGLAGDLLAADAVQLLDIAGRTIETIPIAPGVEQFALPLGNCRAGGYFVQVLQAGQVLAVGKLAVVR